MKYNSIVFAILLFVSTFLSGQTFEIDPGHTFITFSVERFGTVDVSGRFNEFSGTLSFDETKGSINSADLTIDVNSIDSGHGVRDGHLKGEMWLDAGNHSTIVFKTSSVDKTDEGFLAIGELTIKGKTNTIELPFKMKGPAVDPTKMTTIGISADLVLNRQDYGISFSRLMDNGNLFIGNEVTISINALAQMK